MFTKKKVFQRIINDDENQLKIVVKKHNLSINDICTLSEKEKFLTHRQMIFESILDPLNRTKLYRECRNNQPHTKNILFTSTLIC